MPQSVLADGNEGGGGTSKKMIDAWCERRVKEVLKINKEEKKMKTMISEQSKMALKEASTSEAAADQRGPLQLKEARAFLVVPPEALGVLADVLALRAGLRLGQQVSVAALGACRGQLRLAERETTLQWNSTSKKNTSTLPCHGLID